jgi:hypothetical protein
MTKALRIKIDHPGAPPKLVGESQREHFWNTLAVRAVEKSEDCGEKPDKNWAFLARYRRRLRGGGEGEGEPPLLEYQHLERKMRDFFPDALRAALFDKLIKQQSRVIEQSIDSFYIKFAFVDLSYSSLETLVAALGIEKSAAMYGLAMPVIISIIEASVPDALRQSLNLPPGIDFDVTISDEDALASTEPPPSGASPSRLAMAARALSLLNFSYLGPILLGIAVLYFAASAAQDAMKGASTERLTLMQGYADLTKQQLIALSEERKEMSKAAQEVTKAVGTERAALAQVYSDLAKIAAASLKEADTDRLALVEALRKIATDEHGQSVEKLRQAVETIRAAAPIGTLRQSAK